MKTPLSLEQLDAQQAFELPNRELPLVTIVLANVLSGNDVEITVRNIDVAAQVCAQVLNTRPNLTCSLK